MNGTFIARDGQYRCQIEDAVTFTSQEDAAAEIERLTKFKTVGKYVVVKVAATFSLMAVATPGQPEPPSETQTECQSCLFSWLVHHRSERHGRVHLLKHKEFCHEFGA